MEEKEVCESCNQLTSYYSIFCPNLNQTREFCHNCRKIKHSGSWVQKGLEKDGNKLGGSNILDEDILCGNCNQPTSSYNGSCLYCKKSLKKSNTMKDYNSNIDPDDYSQFR